MENAKEEKIINYLKEKYRPTAMILHGSRVRGVAGPHSDWDFIFLYHENLVGGFRELVEGENIEVQSELLPIADENILDKFELKLQAAKVVYEEGNEASELLVTARSIYQKGFSWPKTWPIGPDLWMKGRIGGMKDNLNDPLLFHRYFCQFYPRAIKYWFNVLRHQYSKPEYEALPLIKEEDSEYYNYLTELVSSASSLEQKVDLAGLIRRRLFGDL